MRREKLRNYKGVVLTPDTAAAVEKLISAAERKEWAVSVLGPQGTSDWAPNSLSHAGREVHLRIKHPKADAKSCLDALWGFAVPLGFTPWLRYPEPGNKDTVFHFLGPWQPLFDSLLAEGRGHVAWGALCAAAQCDVGTWKGDKTEGRFLQAQLHRLGFSCGVVDGVVGERTMKAATAAGLGPLSSQQMIAKLKEMEPAKMAPTGRQGGHLALMNRDLVIHTTGGVKAIQTPTGAIIIVDGPGQLIADVGDTK